MKITVFDVEPWERDGFEPLRDEHEVTLVQEPLDASNAADHADAEVISVFIYSKPQRDALEQMQRLKLIATRSTGFDHIDADYCEENGVAVANVPSYGKNTVAEHAFGLLLTLSHRLYEAIDRTRKGDFTSKGLRGFDLAGKTLGVVGTGDIGAHACRIGKGFGMEVIAFDVKPREELADEVGFDYVDLDELLRRSDVVTVHVPGNEKTKDLLARDELAKMKDDAVLINTARGSVVNVEALVEALAQGKLAGAGLDVLPEEPIIREEAELLRSVYEKEHDLDALLADHVLLRLRNVVVTPHSAFLTREAVSRILDTTIENIAAFADEQPRNLVIERAA